MRGRDRKQSKSPARGQGRDRSADSDGDNGDDSDGGRGAGGGRGGLGHGKKGGNYRGRSEPRAKDPYQFCYQHLTKDGCSYGDECKYQHVTQARADELKQKADQARQERCKDDWSASVAIGCPLRYVHYTGPNGRSSHEEFEHVIPDWCTMDETYDSGRASEAEPLAFEGCTPDYMRLSILSYCKARDAAIDLAEGIGQVVPDEDTDCQDDDGDWEGVEPCINDERRRPLYWRPSCVITIQPPKDGFAAYGRPYLRWKSKTHREDREQALEHYRDSWDQYEHLGDVPEFERSHDTANRDPSASETVSAVRGADDNGAGVGSFLEYESVSFQTASRATPRFPLFDG